ncbi:unnamed protein product [Auanema sp. JU1783]|nr:unnamed protein product [Auanema sp. JU1783]
MRCIIEEYINLRSIDMLCFQDKNVMVSNLAPGLEKPDLDTHDPAVSLIKDQTFAKYATEYYFLLSVRLQLSENPCNMPIVEHLNLRMRMISEARKYPGAFHWLRLKRRPKAFISEVRKKNPELAVWLEGEK